MKKIFIYLFFLASLSISHFAIATEPLQSCNNWNGFYLGGTIGGINSHFNTQTTTQTGTLLNSIEANAVNHVGRQTIDTTGFITGILAGYNWQCAPLLLGLETDIQSLSINGDAISGAVHFPNEIDRQFVITSYANINWLFTARPRIGLTANNTLFYITGGLALGYLQSDFLFSDHSGNFESKRVSKIKPGYEIGAGIETGLSKNISLKAEYLFLNFNSTTPSNMNNNVPLGQSFANAVKLKSNIVRVGVNYHFDNQSMLAPNLQIIPEFCNALQWEIEIGTRLYFSNGINGAPQPLLNNERMPLISRLTFSDLNAISGETFASVTHSSGLFAKGYLGAGTMTDGQLNDEDFPAGGAYSNTLSSALGNLSYATLDLGYDFLKTPNAKTGLFVGYNYYTQNINTYSCKQLAGSLLCFLDGRETRNFLGISEDDKFNSLRIGLTTQFNLTDQIVLTSEAAYLPIVGFRGTDLHNARELVGPERSNHGDGAMLETILDYQFCPSWHVGLGGRYWLWNMHRGSVTFDFLGERRNIIQPARFHTKRYGVFLQLSYRENKSMSTGCCATPIHWQGLFIGGHLGGAWGKTHWSDPFGTTTASVFLVNVAGFGNTIKSTGPLGGLHINLNWQCDQWVYGLGASLSAMDFRGENTLFSGIGGVNGETFGNYLLTVVGRSGIAFNSALFYVNLGPAMLNTNYNINANTGILTLGSQSKTINKWGIEGGVGIEYALTDHWTSNVEYDYIQFSRQSISFPFTQVLNNHRYSLRQTMNIFKVGVNYKVDCLR